jgi:disulfide bond formation protein DsbB
MMTPFIQNVTDVFSFGILVLDIAAVALCFILVTPLKRHGIGRDIVDFFGERALFLSFLVALMGTAGSLFYSDVAGFAPCVLCWWQRVFLYPQTILLFTAFLKKDENMRLHSLILSGIGMLFAIYHTFVQFGGESAFPCPAQGGPSCGTFYFLEYGYITVPTMSLTVFILILLFMACPNPKKRDVVEL